MAEQSEPVHCRDCAHCRRSDSHAAYTGRIEPGYDCTRNGKRTPVGPEYSCWKKVPPGLWVNAEEWIMLRALEGKE